MFFYRGLAHWALYGGIRPILKHSQDINKSDFVKEVAAFFVQKGKKKKKKTPLFFKFDFATIN